MRDGAGKKRGSTQPSRAQPSHSSNNSTGEARPISRSRVAGERVMAGSGSRLDLRLLAAGAVDLVAQIAPDPEHQRAIGGIAAQAEHLARTRERHFDN